MKVQKEIFYCANPKFEKKIKAVQNWLLTKEFDKTTETQSITFTESDFTMLSNILH